MFRGIVTVGGWTMVSRVAGFLRDMLIAALAGTGPVADAFFIALRVPNLFRRLFGEGAFNAAFVPEFSGILATEGAAPARQFAQEAIAVMAFWLLLLTALGEIFMPQLMQVLAPGFGEEPGKFQLAVDLGISPTRINTIIDFGSVQQYGVKAEGNAAGGRIEVLAELAQLIADGQLEVPIAQTFPLDQVQQAYRELESGHTLGKIVLLPEEG